MDANDRKLFIQIIGQVLIVDGVLADAERDYLERLMEHLGMGADEKREALRGISLDSPVEERVAGLSQLARAQLLGELEKAKVSDGEVGKAEQAIVDQVRDLLAAG